MAFSVSYYTARRPKSQTLIETPHRFHHKVYAGDFCLLYKPNKDDYALYWKKDCIVVTDLISEAPLSASAPHEICLEKMLVDMYCDKLISSTFSKSEYPQVLHQAMKTYRIETPKMMRYARRRGRESEIKHILEEREYASCLHNI